MTKSTVRTRNICLTALFMALIFVVTRFIQIPIPLGYLNFGNGIILFSCLILPEKCGIASGALGSALADLTSFPIYTLPTLIIKGLMAFVFVIIYRSGKSKKTSSRIAAGVSTLIPLVGYTAAGCLFYGGFGAGIAQLPGLLIEYGANLILFAALNSQILRIRKMCL